jgi:hypothetical protein
LKLSLALHSSLTLFVKKKAFLRFQITGCRKLKFTVKFPPEEDISMLSSDPAGLAVMSRSSIPEPVASPLLSRKQLE